MQSTLMSQYNMQANENHQLNYNNSNKQEHYHAPPAANTANHYYNDGRGIFLVQPTHAQINQAQMQLVNDSGNKQSDAKSEMTYLNTESVQKMDMNNNNNNNSQYLDNQNSSNRNGSNIKEEEEESNSSSTKQRNEDEEKTVMMNNIKNDNEIKDVKVDLKEEEQNNEAISENLVAKKEKVELDDVHGSNSENELINVNKKLKARATANGENGDESNQYISAYEPERKSESNEMDNIMENNAHNASIASTN